MEDDIIKLARRVVERALDGWDDASHLGVLVDPYSIGGGGEGWAFVAERIHIDASFGSPCTSYVVIKFPVIAKGPMARVDKRRVQRLLAEYDRRQSLGDAPHLGHIPLLRFLPCKDLEDEQKSYTRIVIETGETTIPVLVTPLQGTRTGGTVPADLESLIPEDGCWSSREVLNWTVVARGLGRALWSMHGRGWAHSDIKPQNVVLYESRGTWHEVNLIDFGLVEPDMPGTIFGREVGSFHYWRVERLRAAEIQAMYPQDDAKSIAALDSIAHLRPSTEDLYALGVMLAEVLLGGKKIKHLRWRAEDEVPAGVDKSKRQNLVALKYAESIRRAVGEEIGEESALRAFVRGMTGVERPAADPSPRSIAFLLCQSYLMKNPRAKPLHVQESERPTLSILRDFLTNVDTRLVALGDPERTATRLLVNIGASPSARGLKQQRKRYYAQLPEQHRLRQQPITTIETCSEMIRDGYVRHGIGEIKRVLTEIAERCSTVSNGSGMNTAYEVTWGLRLLAGVLLPRDRRYLEAWQILEEWRIKLDVFSGARGLDGKASPREVVSWWIDRLEWRLWRAHQREADLGYVVDGEQQLKHVQPPKVDRARPDAEFNNPVEQQQALAWSDDDALTKSMLARVEVEDTDAILNRAEDYQQSGKSTQEAVHAALQTVRWKLTQLDQLDRLDRLDKLVETAARLFLEALRTWTLAVGWALVADLHHEYASAMVLVANRARKVFGSHQKTVESPAKGANPVEAPHGEPLGPDFATPAEAPRAKNPVGAEASAAFAPASLADSARPLPEGLVDKQIDADGEPRHASGAMAQTNEHPSQNIETILREVYNIDAEAVLSTAAECALAAASTYTDIDSPLLAWRALQVAAQCLSSCEAPEQRVDAVRWLQFAKNDYLLHEVADAPRAIDATVPTSDLKRRVLERSDRAITHAIAQWSERAGQVYKNTAGTDPGAFLSKAMFGRYGAGIAKLTAGSLGVELVGVSGEPSAGEVVKCILDLKRSTIRGNRYRMLEIECGLGHDCKMVGDPPGESVYPRMKEVWGIESMPWCERKARAKCESSKHIQIHGLDIHAPDNKWEEQFKTRLGERRFDVIWMHDVLVRVSDRRRVLERAHSLLEPGGMLMMTDWVQTKQMSQEDWRDLCEFAWLTGPETPTGYKHLLQDARFESVDIEPHNGDMVKAFEWATNAPRGWLSRPDSMAEADFSSILRAEQSFAALLHLANAKKLGWIWVTARRPNTQEPTPISSDLGK